MISTASFACGDGVGRHPGWQLLERVHEAVHVLGKCAALAESVDQAFHLGCRDIIESENRGPQVRLNLGVVVVEHAAQILKTVRNAGRECLDGTAAGCCRQGTYVGVDSGG